MPPWKAGGLTAAWPPVPNFAGCDSVTGAEVIGRKSGDYSGLLIPYFQPETNQVRGYRLRRDHPDLEYDVAGNLKVRQKYLSAPGRSNMLYLPPGVSHSLLSEPATPIVITEGEFKTLALWRAANHGVGSRPRFLPLGVSGVYNWRGTIVLVQRENEGKRLAEGKKIPPFGRGFSRHEDLSVRYGFLLTLWAALISHRP